MGSDGKFGKGKLSTYYFNSSSMFTKKGKFVSKLSWCSVLDRFKKHLCFV